MKYSLSKANGDAGEFFAAYKIAKELGWPCRLFDIDIGIDAQVEILTENCDSTGRFVALQVKSTSAEERDYCYVTARHLQYWSSLEIPVFVVLVDLQKELMYLHLYDEMREYDEISPGWHKISFDLASDLFTPSSAMVMDKASERFNMTHIRRYHEHTEQEIQRLFESEYEHVTETSSSSTEHNARVPKDC